MRAATLLKIGASAAVCALMAPLASRGQVVWTGAGANENYTTPGNWQGGVVPPNTGADSAQFVQNESGQINLNTAANLSGISFQGTSGSSFDSFYQVNGGTLTLGSGGISAPGGISAFSLYYAPIILSASQTWSSPNAYLFADGTISETSGSAKTLTTSGTVYLQQDNSFTGGVNVISGQLYLGADSSAGTGPISLADNTTLETYYPSADVANISNPITIGNNVTFGAIGFQNPGAPSTLNLNGSITLQDADTTLLVYGNSLIGITGAVSAPASTSLDLEGYGGTFLPFDGGSQVNFQGTLSNVSSVTVDNLALILGPSVPVGTAYPNLSPGGVHVVDSAYLGLDGTFTTPGAVSTFLSTYVDPSTFNGTLGFDSFNEVQSPGSPNVFSDPIDLSGFTSGEGFIGLGSMSSATLTGNVTPTSDNVYVFGGGGGTLTVTSDLEDNGGTSLLMSDAPEPLTVILQGANNYTGGVTSSGGVLIFDSGTLPTGGITLNGGYVGYTETPGITAASFLGLFNGGGTGVVGFDQSVPNRDSPREVGDDIDMTLLSSEGSIFIGTATAANLTGNITPANNQYLFTGVKGGDLSVTSSLTGTASVTVGLQGPLEANGSISTVNITPASPGNNTYTGGTTLYSGQLWINSDNALGTGPISAPATAETIYSPFLAPFGPATVTLANQISIGQFSPDENPYPGLEIGDGSDGGSMLILTGVISDYPGQQGLLSIDGPVTLTGGNTYTGGTNFTGTGNAVAYVGGSTPLGTGPITIQANAAIIPFNGDVTLPNDINVGSSLTLGETGNGFRLTLNGVLSGVNSILIESNVTLNGDNSGFLGNVQIDGANVVVGNPNALGEGSLDLENASITDSDTNPLYQDLTGGSGSSIGLVPGAVLTLNTDTALAYFDYSGDINGDSTDSVVISGTGVQGLFGNGSYGGGTTVMSGTLLAGSPTALGTGTVTVESGAALWTASPTVLTNAVTLSPGATLGGNGTFSTPGGTTLSGGTTVSPGTNGNFSAYADTLTFGTPLTFGAGGKYLFDVQNASGAAGVGYDTVNVTGAPGTLTVSASPGTPFTIALESIDPSGFGTPGLATFNASQTYSWTLVSASSISWDGNVADFTINTSAFQNPLNGGTFIVAQSGNSLVLDFTPVPEPSTWLLMATGIAVLAIRVRRKVRA